MSKTNGSTGATGSSGGGRPTSAVGVLNSSHNAHKEELLAKIGGRDVLHEAVDMFYDRLLKDPRLKHLFEGANITVLKWHQYNIMSIAFSDVPNTFDIDRLILEKHAKLFEEKGMDGSHYDVVMEHFEGTLKDLKVDPQAAAEAAASVAGLKAAFQRGAVKAEEAKRSRIRNRRIALVALIAAAAAFAFQRRGRSSRR